MITSQLLKKVAKPGIYTDASLATDPANDFGFTVTTKSLHDLVLRGLTSRNHYSFDSTGWPLGARITMTLNNPVSQRVIIRGSENGDLNAPRVNYFDQTFAGLMKVDITLNDDGGTVNQDFFGFLTIAARDLIVSDFSVVF